VVRQFRLDPFDNPATAKVPADHAAVAHQVAEQAVGAPATFSLKPVEDLAAKPIQVRAGSGDHLRTVIGAKELIPPATRSGEA